MNKTIINKVVEILENEYQEVACTLNYRAPLELLISTMLSAQCTDARVNIVTPMLFSQYKSVNDFADADIKAIEEIIRSTGFYHNKAQNMINCCIQIRDEYNGEIPAVMEELVKLSGVGRKTANVYLSEIHHTPGIIVDTHAKRLTNRIGLTKQTEPEKIERDLMKKIPKEKWSDFSHRLVFHGRAVCHARNPKCEICKLNEICEYNKKNIKKDI
ncbi:MAG: endonuclease III [Clostridia bacterium]|nr:endonuclease III [Clostridia bacterium]